MASPIESEICCRAPEIPATLPRDPVPELEVLMFSVLEINKVST